MQAVSGAAGGPHSEAEGGQGTIQISLLQAEGGSPGDTEAQGDRGGCGLTTGATEADHTTSRASLPAGRSLPPCLPDIEPFDC